MTLKCLLPILMLATLGVLPGQELSWMHKGDEAMASRLWEIAAHHYQAHLSQPDLEPDERALASIRLAEAWIHDGKAEVAADLLAQSHVSKHPEAPYWIGQALAARGRFAQAVEILKPLIDLADAAHRQEAGFTTASLELALDQPDDALKTLSRLAAVSTPQQVTRVRLRQTEILLDLGRVEEAREIMPNKASLDSNTQSNALFIEANILLREKRFDEAAELFKQIVENPINLSIRRYHASWIGWADALLAQQQRVSAADLLLNFIQQHPESPQLEEVFKRLLSTIPDEPSISDPILVRLIQWIGPVEIPTTGLVPVLHGNAQSAWPSEAPTSDLTAFSLFTRAVGLHRLNSPAAKHEARSLINRLRLEYPTHFLINRALLMQARWHLDEGRIELARHLLSTLRETATSPLIKGKAAFVEAQATSGDLEQPQTALELFQQAAELLQGVEADTARFNAALIQLIQNDDADEIPSMAALEDPALTANLQLERALLIVDPAKKRLAIDSFLLEHPDHPRAAEARLSAAEAALIGNTTDISFASAQIETIEADPEQFVTVPPARVALLKLRIADLSGESEQAISTARTLIADFPASPESIEASFILGRKLFATSNYNDARIVLEKIATSVSEENRAQAAWLLAARSAALIPTTQSQQEALSLFDKAIATKGPITPLAKLEKARLMIDMSQLTEAAAFLKPWYESLPQEDPLHFACGLLLGESIYAQGNLNPESLSQALKIYDELIATTGKFTPEYDRLQYLRGLTLEQLPDPEWPDLKREKEALIAYYSVLEREQPPPQWEYFELCGFRALSLLEKARRWPAAIACAKKIALFKGPRADEAAARANQIQLKYMIWED